jgi:hypothetical protein
LPQQIITGMFPFAQFVGKLCRIRLPDRAAKHPHPPDLPPGAMAQSLKRKRVQSGGLQ